MDILISLRRKLRPWVERLGLRRPARVCFRWLARWRYRRQALVRVRQNDREWMYHFDVAIRDEYQEFDTVMWLRKILQPGDCAIDVGANVGQMTLEMALLVGPTGRVIAVEPAPGNLELLRCHIEANGVADRVEIVPAACCARHGGQISLRVFGHRPSAVGSGHTIVGTDAIRRLETGDGSTCSIEVAAVSVDGLCRERNLAPKAVKIDVEGAELEVLRGMAGTLEKARPVLRFGFHPAAFSDPACASAEICALLSGCGYAVNPATPAVLKLEEYDVYPVNR